MRSKRNELKSYNQAIRNKNRYMHYNENTRSEKNQKTFKSRSEALKYRLSPEFLKNINQSFEIEKYRKNINQVISEAMTYSHLSFMKDRILETAILRNSLSRLEKRFNEIKMKLLKLTKNQI